MEQSFPAADQAWRCGLPTKTRVIFPPGGRAAALRQEARMSISTFQVRRLVPADFQVFRKLNIVFAEAFADPDTYGAQPPGDAYLQGLLGKEHVVVLAALADRHVLGGL